MRLLSLGTAQLVPTSGAASATLAVGKPYALLLYLSAAPNRSATRSALISLLWADLEPDAAKHALRQTIWYLKKKSGRELVRVDGDTLSLGDEVQVDRDALLEASKRGDHARVVELYAGPFVSSFAAPGGAGFEEWASLERRRLLELFRHSAQAVITAQLSSGKARDAIPLARRLRDADVNHEGGWRLLIECCISADDLLSARAEAEALQQLAEQDEIELEPPTRALLRTLRGPANGKPSPEGERAGEPNASVLVGREEVFAALLAAWDATKSGASARLHITARPGLGKTRLLRDLATRIRAMRGRVVSVGGSLGIRDVEYAVAGDLAAGLAALPGHQAIAPESAATLVDLNPSLSTWFDRTARSVAREDLLRARTLAVRELMAAVSFEHPVAILVDDLHWWDEASSTLLSAAIDGIGESRVLLVTAGRPEARRAALVSSASTVHLELDPLTAAQVEELVLGIASLPAEPWAESFAADLWRASRGSPLLALGMLRYLEERALLLRSNGSWASPRPEVLRVELQQGDVFRTRLAELERAEVWMLTLLATGASTLARDVLVKASEQGGEEVLARMASLEARGFVVRHDDGWRIAHDEIAGEVLRLSTADVTARAAGRLGKALAALPFDEARARRAMQLLRTTSETTARADLFRAFGTRRYALGDRRSASAIAADLLGPTARPDEVSELRRAAPLTWRLGLVSPTRQVAALLGVVALGALSLLLFAARTTPQPDAELALAFADNAGRVEFEVVKIRQAGWSPQDTLIPERWTAGPAITMASTNSFAADYDAKNGRMITSQPVPDSGVIDLFLYRAGEGGRRFVPDIRDDGDPRFSPDGSAVVFTTARWDSLMHYDLAIAALEDSAATPLTSGPASDVAPHWSPDGSRIAFARSTWGKGPNQVCVVRRPSTKDPADEPVCVKAQEAGAYLEPVGWLDDDRLIVYSPITPMTQLSIMQWPSGVISPLADIGRGATILSPDAAWVLCTCVLTANGSLAPGIAPLSAPNLVRPIRQTSSNGRVFLNAFWLSSSASITPASVRISTQPLVTAGVPAQLRASLFDGRGTALSPRLSARWRISDPNAGTIDSLSGILTTTGTTPTVTVVATATTGIVDSLTIPVDRDTARMVLEERWSSLEGWWKFGVPNSQTSVSPSGGFELLTNGDGSYESGVLSRATVNPRRGIAVEADVSSPITELQWQSLHIALRRVTDTTEYVKAWEQNATPRVALDAEPCGFSFPNEGRLTGRNEIAALASTSGTSTRTVAGIGNGRRWRLRLQLFADGRCGVAIDGDPQGIVDGGAPITGALHAVIDGGSKWTRIAVGSLRIYEGVLRDIDWSNVPVLR